MASESSNDTEITSIFSSISGEYRWVHQMEKNFKKELKIDIKCDLPCISRVPKTLRAEKPEAYAPKRIGLGPYHHFRPELYHMEREKLNAVKKVLTTDQTVHFRQLIVDKLVELEPQLLACYDEFLDINGHTLAWIWAIDGLFLYHHLGVPVDSACKNVLAQDIFLLENQIPIILLKEIDEVIHQFRLSDKVENQIPIILLKEIDEVIHQFRLSDKVENQIPIILLKEIDEVIHQFQLSDKVVRDFCEAHSPLKWTNKHGKGCVERTPAHLLDCLYHLVVNDGNIHLKVRKEKRKEGKHPKVVRMGAAQFVGTAISVVQNVEPIIDRIKQLQLDKICSPLFNKYITAAEIDIPSVSSLQKNAGVKFAIAKEGIRGIKFNDETCTLNLPEITLNDNSEVILRNLVAYESLAMPAGSTRELAEYIDLMCGIIDTAEDVKILEGQKIILIQGDLSHHQIANIFNGITKSTDKDKHSKLVVEKVNKHYDSMLMVKAWRFVKKCLDSSWNFVKASWKVLCFFYSLILISVLILQAFCNIYGCSWGQSKSFILRMVE